ncbi:MAG: DUF1614 domain-containing protein [Candidatus Aminicenantes bacterium]|nr:DUF1614 domain-containing protein [Candidatus Aminicenantes bacterium]
MFFLPVVFLIILVYFCLLTALFLLLKIGLITFAFQKIGLQGETIFLLLFFCLIGSWINLPIKKIYSEEIVPQRIIDFFGWKVKIPAARFRQSTILAVNLGGAIIPTTISLFLILKWWSLWPYFLVATTLVSFLVNLVAKPIKGLGIATPALYPPAVAALISFILITISPLTSESLPVIAYVCGTLGTLIGADLLNLKKIGSLGAPVASIGGAGTFDGVFLTGIIAVLLTSF